MPSDEHTAGNGTLPQQESLRQLAQATSKQLDGSKWKGVYNAVLSLIEAGLWEPGVRMPPEKKVAEVTGVALGTVQKVMRLLSDEGIITRTQGRGTYVAAAATSSRELRHFRFLESDGHSIAPVYSRVMGIDVTAMPSELKRFFGASFDLIRIRRLASISLQVQGYSERFLPLERFKDILEIPQRELDGASLTYMLSEKFNAPTLRVAQHFQVNKLPDDVCETLKISADTTGMRWDLFCLSYRDAPISYQLSYLPPSDMRLLVD